jgi:hypothetical protein
MAVWDLNSYTSNTWHHNMNQLYFQYLTPQYESVIFPILDTTIWIGHTSNTWHHNMNQSYFQYLTPQYESSHTSNTWHHNMNRSCLQYLTPQYESVILPILDTTIWIGHTSNTWHHIMNWSYFQALRYNKWNWILNTIEYWKRFRIFQLHSLKKTIA